MKDLTEGVVEGFGGPAPPKEKFDYKVEVRVTDRFRKPANLQFQKTDERINWIESVDADGFEDETSAGIAAIGILSRWWKPKMYDLEIVSVQKKLVQKPHLILPR